MPGTGMGMIGNFASQGMNMFFDQTSADMNENRQVRTQRKLYDIANEYNKEQTARNYALGNQWWEEKLSPKAQMKQMKEAGLNPALMYGKGGSGGVTMAQPQQGSVSAPQASANYGSGAKGDGMAMMLLEAQLQNLNADTAKKQAEATKTAGVDTGLAEAQTASLTQGIKNQKAAEELTRVETNLKKIEVNFADESYEERMDAIEWQVKQGMETVNGLRMNNEITAATMEDKIKQIKAEAIGAVLRNSLTQAQIANTKQSTEKLKSDIEVNTNQINKWAEEIKQGWEKLSQSDKIMKVEALMKEVEAYNKGMTVGTLRMHDPVSVTHQIDLIMEMQRKDWKKPKNK